MWELEEFCLAWRRGTVQHSSKNKLMADGDYDSRYLQFFECFNQQRFFEAHEALEPLWLPQRQGPNGCFYKGLIQLAGAFVHLNKGRPAPAERLLELAQENLRKYPACHEGLAVATVIGEIADWLGRTKSANPGTNHLIPPAAPQLHLQHLTGGTQRRRGAE